jgi:hypothetical protein
MDKDKVIKDAQYRKGLSIAFFNATNSAIALVVTNPEKSKSKTLARVIEYRDFFLEEHKNYYATVIANIGGNYKAENSIAKLKASKNYEDLNTAWRMLSADERKDEAIKKVALELKTKFKNEKA